jgi:hypothetical protein
MGYSWIISLALAAILISASQGAANVGVGYAPDVARLALAPITLAAMALVFFFYYLRFSEWSTQAPRHIRIRPPRFYTSAIRYRLSAGIYALLMTAAFLGIYLFPKSIAEIIALLQGGLQSAHSLVVSGAPATTGTVTVGGPAASASALVSSAPTPWDAFLDNLRTFLTQAPQDDSWLFAALAAIIVIWPKLPFSTDDAIRDTLQRFAAIPTEAQGLIQRLRYNPKEFAPSAVVIHRVLGGTNLLGFEDFSPFRYARTESDGGERLAVIDRKSVGTRMSKRPTRIGHQFAKLCYLTDRLAHQGIDRRTSILDRAQPDRFEDIEKRLAEIEALLIELRSDMVDALADKQPEALGKALSCTGNACRIAALRMPVQRIADLVDSVLGPDSPEHRLLERRRQEIEARIRDALDRLYYYIVTTVLAAEPSQENQLRRFRRYGFELSPSWQPLQETDALTTLMVLVLLAVLIPTLAYWLVSADLDADQLRVSCGRLIPGGFGEALGWSVVGVVQNALAIVAAFVLMFAMNPALQEASGQNHPASGRHEFRKFTWHISAILNGGSLAFVVNLLFFATLLRLAPAASSCTLGTTWVWTLIPAVAGAFTALYLALPWFPRQVFRWPPWQAVASGLVAAGVAIHMLRFQTQLPPPAVGGPAVMGSSGFEEVSTAILAAAAVGLILGLLAEAQLRKLEQRLGDFAPLFRLSWLLVLLVLAALLALAVIDAHPQYSPWTEATTETITRWLGEPLPIYIEPGQTPMPHLLAVAFCAFATGASLTLAYHILLTLQGSESARAPHRPAAGIRRATRRQAFFALLVAVLHAYIYYVVTRALDGIEPGTTAAVAFNFAFYCFIAATAVGLLSGFFVLTLRESSLPHGSGFTPYLSHDAIEVRLQQREPQDHGFRVVREGKLVVIPEHERRALILQVDGRYDVSHAAVVVDPRSAEGIAARFTRTRPDEGDEHALHWVELVDKPDEPGAAGQTRTRADTAVAADRPAPTGNPRQTDARDTPAGSVE